MKTNERRARGLFWDKAWKLVEGCTKVSPGCDNCWSEIETAMRACHPNEKISDRNAAVLRDDYSTAFSGRILLREDNLNLPLRTKKPTVWAIWNDLYHEDVPDSFRDRAYAVMALCPQHTFLVLTKRAQRMAKYWREYSFVARADTIEHIASLMGWESWLRCKGVYPDGLLNVWHGVSIEDQQHDERIAHLLLVPGKRFINFEPMLGPVDLIMACRRADKRLDRLSIDPVPSRPLRESGLHAVLLGGESGPNARPMHPQWARDVRDQCAAAGVPFFFKQWGEWVGGTGERKMYVHLQNEKTQAGSKNTHEWGDGCVSQRVGKKKAGRLLDGRTHDELPWGGESC